MTNGKEYGMYIAVIDRVILKGRCIVISNTLQKQALEQFHINYIGMEKQNFLHANQYIGQVLIAIVKNT